MGSKKKLNPLKWDFRFEIGGEMPHSPVCCWEGKMNTPGMFWEQFPCGSSTLGSSEPFSLCQRHQNFGKSDVEQQSQA